MERRKIDWCSYFKKLEDDPSAMTPNITVREFMQAREHLYGCDACFNRSERVIAKAPKDPFPKMEKN